MSIFIDRTDKAKFAKGSILFLVSVALVAAVTIVLFSVSSILLLDVSKETLTQSRNDNSPPENKVIGAVVSPMDSDASPVPAQTKSPSAGNADIMSSSRPVPPFTGMLTEETLAAAALKPTPERKASATAVETSNGSSPELGPSQELRASPASIAGGVTAVETSNGATRAPSIDETPPS
jgi:hypothetical protein